MNALGIAPCMLVLDHELRMGTEKQIVHIRGITAGKGAGQTEDVSAGACQSAEGISLAGFVFKLMDLIGDKEIKKSLHLCLDEFRRYRLAVLFLFDIRLPELLVADGRMLVMPLGVRVITPFPYSVFTGIAFLVSPLSVLFKDRYRIPVFIEQFLAAFRAEVFPRLLTTAGLQRKPVLARSRP